MNASEKYVRILLNEAGQKIVKHGAVMEALSCAANPDALLEWVENMQPLLERFASLAKDLREYVGETPVSADDARRLCNACYMGGDGMLHLKENRK